MSAKSFSSLRSSSSFPSPASGITRTRVLSREGRIYILPTLVGFIYALTLFTFLVVAFHFASEFVLFLDFALTAIFFLALVQTHYNLVGITLKDAEAQGCFAGETIHACFMLSNDSRRVRNSLQLDLRQDDASEALLLAILPGQTESATLSFTTKKRGRFEFPKLCISTTYPLGLFRSWTWRGIKNHYDVYPYPKGSAAPPPEPTGLKVGAAGQSSGQEDFYGQRVYQAGDSLKHVNWKARAKGYPLYTKIFRGEGQRSVLLDWDALPPGLAIEDRLSQLCLWLVAARARHGEVALKLPGVSVPYGVGTAHYQRCLSELAAFEGPGESPNLGGKVGNT